MKKGLVLSIILIIVIAFLIYLFTTFIPSRTLILSKCSSPVNLFCMGENNSISKDKIRFIIDEADFFCIMLSNYGIEIVLTSESNLPSLEIPSITILIVF